MVLHNLVPQAFYCTQATCVAIINFISHYSICRVVFFMTAALPKLENCLIIIEGCKGLKSIPLVLQFN